MKKTRHVKATRKRDEDKLPFGKDNCKATFTTHPILYSLFTEVGKANLLKKYMFFNRFCIKYLEKEINQIESDSIRNKLLNELKKVPKL